MKIFLDDCRQAPDNSFVVCRTADEAIGMLKRYKVEFISFDHDLADNSVPEKTGYTVACFIEEMVISGKISMPDYQIHSANPIGAKRISQAMESAKRFS